MDKKTTNASTGTNRENPTAHLTDDALIKLRSNLELELYELDVEKHWIDDWDLSDPYERTRTSRDVEIDRDFVLYKIETVEEELAKRGMKDEWMKV